MGPRPGTRAASCNWCLRIDCRRAHESAQKGINLSLGPPSPIQAPPTGNAGALVTIISLLLALGDAGPHQLRAGSRLFQRPCGLWHPPDQASNTPHACRHPPRLLLPHLLKHMLPPTKKTRRRLSSRTWLSPACSCFCNTFVTLVPFEIPPSSLTPTPSHHSSLRL